MIKKQLQEPQDMPINIPIVTFLPLNDLALPDRPVHCDPYPVV